MQTKTPPTGYTIVGELPLSEFSSIMQNDAGVLLQLSSGNWVNWSRIANWNPRSTRTFKVCALDGSDALRTISEICQSKLNKLHVDKYTAAAAELAAYKLVADKAREEVVRLTEEVVRLTEANALLDRARSFQVGDIAKARTELSAHKVEAIRARQVREQTIAARDRTIAALQGELEQLRLAWEPKRVPVYNADAFTIYALKFSNEHQLEMIENRNKAIVKLDSKVTALAASNKALEDECTWLRKGYKRLRELEFVNSNDPDRIVNQVMEYIARAGQLTEEMFSREEALADDGAVCVHEMVELLFSDPSACAELAAASPDHNTWAHQGTRPDALAKWISQTLVNGKKIHCLISQEKSVPEKRSPDSRESRQAAEEIKAFIARQVKEYTTDYVTAFGLSCDRPQRAIDAATSPDGVQGAPNVSLPNWAEFLTQVRTLHLTP